MFIFKFSWSHDSFIHSYSVKTDWFLVRKKPNQAKTKHTNILFQKETSNLVISLTQRPLLQLLGSLHLCLCLGFIKWMTTSTIPKEVCPILPLVLNTCSLQSCQRPRNRLNKLSLAYLRIALLPLIQISVTWTSNSGCFAFCTKLPKYWVQAKHCEEKSISTVFFLAYTALYD